MSSSIKIPRRTGLSSQTSTIPSSPRTDLTASSSESIQNTPSSYQTESHITRSAEEKGKNKVASPRDINTGRRRTSWMSSSLSKSEHTVVNIGGPDGVPRLITCVKASQGFDWNTGIFLPSYMADHDDAAEMEHRQDPVEDIFLTEEEEREMFPIGNL